MLVQLRLGLLRSGSGGKAGVPGEGVNGWVGWIEMSVGG